MSEQLLCTEKNQVAYVSLNRPQVKNAMNAELISDLSERFRSFGSRKDLRAVVLAGVGEFFCAGGDLNWMKSSVEKTQAANEADARELGKMIRTVDECPLPVICLVQGGAFGGGVGLVAASDIVLAEEDAMFSLSEVKLGLIPATIGPLVMRKIGSSQARRLYLTGLRFDAGEAQKVNLIHESVGKGQLQKTLHRYLKEFESSGPEAVQHAKRLIRELQGQNLWKENIAEETSKVLSQIRVGAEAQEGISAFLEKRKPSWKAHLISES